MAKPKLLAKYAKCKFQKLTQVSTYMYVRTYICTVCTVHTHIRYIHTYLHTYVYTYSTYTYGIWREKVDVLQAYYRSTYKSNTDTGTSKTYIYIAQTFAVVHTDNTTGIHPCIYIHDTTGNTIVVYGCVLHGCICTHTLTHPTCSACCIQSTHWQGTTESNQRFSCKTSSTKEWISL